MKDFSVKEIISSKKWINGEYIRDFELKFAKYIGRRYAIGCNSGSSALLIAVMALKQEHPEITEVLTVPNSYVATANSIRLAGCAVRFTDVNKDTWLLDSIPDGANTIVPVHLFGNVVDGNFLRSISKKYYMIEDCAQSTGAFIDGKKAGSFSDLSCFSFYPSKTLFTVGPGGMITTDNKELAEMCRLLINYGESMEYFSKTIGFNLRMGEIEAYSGLFGLERLDEWNVIRRETAKIYIEEFGDKFDYQKANGDHVYQNFPILHPQRNKLMGFLSKKGIQTKVHYPIPIHKQLPYRDKNLKFPAVEMLAKQELSLPCHPAMMDEEVKYVINNVKAWAKRWK